MSKVKCNKEMEVYCRVVGYYRPKSNCNPGKKQEIEDRLTYDLDKSLREIREEKEE